MKKRAENINRGFPPGALYVDAQFSFFLPCQHMAIGSNPESIATKMPA